MLTFINEFNTHYTQTVVGTMTVQYSNIDTLGIVGNQTSIFNPDLLYRFYNAAADREFWFKYNFNSYNSVTNITSLGVGQYLGNIPDIHSTPITYAVTSYDWRQTNIFTSTLCIIGDSITWYAYGSYLRNLMRNLGLHLDFVGHHIDTFGFGHEGEGGDNTINLLNRKTLIPAADKFIVWAGTNDIGFTADAAPTISNILALIDYLHTQYPQAHFYVPLLLQRNDFANARNLAVNALWHNTAIPLYVTLIDMPAMLPAMPAWNNYLIDGLHPTLQGYTLIAPLLKTALE